MRYYCTAVQTRVDYTYCTWSGFVYGPPEYMGVFAADVALICNIEN